jgi:hypothetical protein
MACQRPVIAARGSGVEEVLRDGTEALLYSPGDAASLASSIIFLLRNPKQRRLLAKRGYRRVREQYCESSQRRLVLQAYRELLGIAHKFSDTPIELTRDSTPPVALPESISQSDEPVTAVMHAAEANGSVRINPDTAQIHGPIDEPCDTQPSIIIDQHDQPPQEEIWDWGASSGSAQLGDVNHQGSRPETRKLPAIIDIPDDTSRIAALSALNDHGDHHDN